MALTYFVLLTAAGAAKLANATATATTLKVTHMAVGDGGGNVPTPDPTRTTLINEKRRAPLNTLTIDPANVSQIIAEQVIPEDVGGWWIRELGLFDDSGALVAYANCAPTYKPMLAEGSGRTQTVRVVLAVSNTASVELLIDPSIVLATRDYVDSSILTALNRLDYKQSVRAATTANISLNGLQTLDGIVLAVGDRVLVKNQNNAADNGLYLAAAGAWRRTSDADENSEVTPGLTVTVESGSSLADTMWQVVTDGQIVLGTTALTFQNITNGLAPLSSPSFTGVPTAPTAAQFRPGAQVATLDFVKVRGHEFSNIYSITASTVLPASYAGTVVHLAGSGGKTITLPPANTVPRGAVITLTSVVPIGSVDTIQCNGSDGVDGLLNGAAMSASKSFPLRGGDTVTLASYGYSGWIATSNSSSNFIAQQAPFVRGDSYSSGYQVFPSGFIFQWVTGVCDAAGNLSVVLPIQFPNAFMGGLAGEANPWGWGDTGRVTVWAFDPVFSTKSVALARARDVKNGGPFASPNISGRILVWGY